MNKELQQKISDLISGGRIRYTGGEIVKSQRSVSLDFVCTVAVDEETTGRIASVVKNYLPQSFDRVNIRVNKKIVQNEFVVSGVVGYLRQNHLIACAGVNGGDVLTEISGCEVKVTLYLEESVYNYFNERNVAAGLKAYLEKTFAEDFSVLAENKGRLEADAKKLEYVPTERERQVYFRRTLKVDEVGRLFDDDDTREATYICDTTDMLGVVYLAGTVSDVKEQMTKNDKPFFRIEFNDRTGSVSGACFPNKDKIPKLRKIEVGSDIIIRGEFEMRGEYRNLRILSVNWCVFPKNFVPQERPKRPVPSEYGLVFPKPVEFETQDNFLDYKPVPECFNGRKFVVFDFETTGTDFDDRITEIGAVKIEDGKITEYFQTLVNPKKHIPTVVTELTGIDDGMVATAPEYADVCPDFYKFCYGTTLVAHNIEFDSRFLKNQSKPLDYYFDNPLMDTLAIGREVIPRGVANYKLNTLCEKFGIVFRHHRAYSDALATAELFIELIRIRGDLPF